MDRPVYERHVYIGSGFPVVSFLSLDPENEDDEPVGLLKEYEDSNE